TPESDESDEETGEINADGGSGDGESSEGSTESEEPDSGTENETSGNENIEGPDNTDNQNSGNQQNQQSEEGNLPYGGGGASEPNDQEAAYGASDTDEANQTERIIEGGQETGEEEQQTEPQQNKKPGVAGKKLYRYNYGNILNGIDIKPGSTEENYSELDKRINRIMTSKIVEEEDMTEEEILEIEEEIKNESGVVSS